MRGRLADLVVPLIAAVLVASHARAEIAWDYVKPASERSVGSWMSDILGVSEFGLDYAVIVGLHRFESFNPLDATENDPQRVFEFLRDEAGFDYILMLRDHEVTYQRLRTLFEFELPRVLDRNDRFLFFWSGHGTQFPDARGVELGYLPLVSSPADDKSTMVAMRDFARWDNELPAKHALFLLDACFSGLAGTTALSDDPDLEIRELAKPGHHIIAAGGRDQQTIASRQQWQGSIFTHALLEALRGAADRYGGAEGGDGVINLYELVADIGATVKNAKAAAGWNRPLRPVLNVLRGEGQFFFLTEKKKRDHLAALGKRVGDDMLYGMPVVVMGSVERATTPDGGDPYGGRDAAVFAIIQDSEIAKDFETFLKDYPDSAFAPYARNRQGYLRQSEHAPPAPGATAPSDLAPDGRRTEKKGSPLQLEAGYEFQDCDHCPVMVVIPSGSFFMGSPLNEPGRQDDEGPQHMVTIPRSLALGKYEVTFDEWAVCVDYGGCDGYKPEDQGWGRGQRPVINVSWIQANTYLRWLRDTTSQRYRLPSEAEWEYAARAGTTTTYWWDKDTNASNEENYRKTLIGRTMPVGEFRPNSWGMFDTIGNVREWTEDCWNNTYRAAPQDGSAWKRGNCEVRVLRGGFWNSDAADYRLANRLPLGANGKNDTTGFRVAREIDQ